MSPEVVPHWIDGEAYEGAPARVGDIYDPATGVVQRRVGFAEPEVVDAAVDSARRALEGWSDTPLPARASILFAFRDIVASRTDELAQVVSREHGKVLPDARGEVARGLDVIEFACGIKHLLKGEHSASVSSGVDTYSVRQPVGVVAGITPFNFPVMVPLWMFPLAIACGNTFVLKPSEKDPSASLLMAQMFKEAGLPDGVLNVVQGDRVAVERLLEHPAVAAVSSVGSTPVARSIYETASRNGKRVQALGGAKNHLVVLPDADMDLAADAIVGSAYGSTGQRCMAISAVVAVGEAGDRLRVALAERMRKLKVGPASDPAAEMGPLVSSEARDKVLGYIETGQREGADLAVDGSDPAGGDGFFVGPCLFDHVTTEMTIYADEIFGPVLCMLRAESLADAIGIVNGNRYGNGTAVFTTDGAAARTFERAVEVGMVGVNVPIPVPVAEFSFGGWRSSLFGDLHVYGTDAIRFYTRQKVVTSRWEDAAPGVRLGFPTS